MTASIREIFTEAEWDAIYEAMADYQDHGEEETDLAHSVQSKISDLLNYDSWYTDPNSKASYHHYWYNKFNKRGWCIPLKTHHIQSQFLIMKTQFTAFEGNGLVSFEMDQSTASIRYTGEGKTYTYNVPNVEATVSDFNRVEGEGGSIGNFVSQCRKNQSLVEITAWSSLEV